MKKKLKKKCKPKKRPRNVQKESDDDEQINNFLVDDGDDLKEDLEVLLDNFGHSISEPILTGRSQEKASSVLEVSVRKVVYNNRGKEKLSTDFPVSTEPNSFTFPTTSAHCDDYDAVCATQCHCDCSNIRHPSDSLCNCRNDDSVGADLQSSLCKKCSCMKCTNCMDCNCQEQQQQRIGKRYAEEIDDVNQYKNEIRGLRKERINRYNLNHIQYSRTPPAPRNSKKWSFFSLWSSNKGNKKQKYKNNIKYVAGKNHFDGEMSSGSGVTIPQLYKANVSNTLGITPGVITFDIFLVPMTGCPQLYEIPETYYKEGISNESMIFSGRIPNTNDPAVISAEVPAGKSKEMMDEYSKVDKNANSRNAVHKAHSKGEKLNCYFFFFFLAFSDLDLKVSNLNPFGF
uniref:Uncharacterized protein n=1 Tax=Rhodnius prolixus TaxID=13249 RepID=T1HTS8_RHOPR